MNAEQPAEKSGRVASAIKVFNTTIQPGTRQRLEIPVARLPTDQWVTLNVEIVHGKRPGPMMWVSGAIHGDELNGVEVVRQILEEITPSRLSGTLFAIPIVNGFGLMNRSRNLPDGRDLNRSFPGSLKGSLAARLAKIFMTEIVSRCTHGIDLHTGSNHRTNLPQIRACLDHPETLRCAKAFAAPVIVDAKNRDGSLRAAANKLGKAVLLYEAGEPLRLDNLAISIGVAGALRVMTNLKMLKVGKRGKQRVSVRVENGKWVRAKRSGMTILKATLGQMVVKGEVIANVRDSFGDNSMAIKSPHDGIIIGHTNNPVTYQGDAIVNIAKLSDES